jgi:hypothetical protein
MLSQANAIQLTKETSMKTRIQFVTVVFALALFLIPCVRASAAQPLLVNGVMISDIIHGFPDHPVHGAVLTASETWEGSLVGTGIAHNFSSEPAGPGVQLNGVGESKVFTSDGNLFLSNSLERHQTLIDIVSVVTGGTGIYKGASGALTLTGMFDPSIPGRANFVYSGIIYLED